MRVLIKLAAIGIIGCSGGSASPASCVPGAVVECPCGGGVSGAQTCNGDGTFGACTCSVDGSVIAPDTEVPDSALDTFVADTAIEDAAVDTTMPVESGGMCPSSTGCIVKVPIPTSKFTVSTSEYTICPGGAKPGATVPECILEIDLGKASWDSVSGGAGTSFTGGVPMRVLALPVSHPIMGRTMWVLGGTTGCPPSEFATIAANVTLADVGLTARVGCDSATVLAESSSLESFRSALRSCPPSPLVEFLREGLSAAIKTEADKALRDAATTAACRTL